MTTTPNSRGWRSADGMMFVDIGRVLVAYYDAHNAVMEVCMRGARKRVGAGSATVTNSFINLDMPADDARSFFDALEIYRSGA